MTQHQTLNTIQSLGGFAHIDDMPLEQQNAYAAEQFKDSLSLSAEYLYSHAMAKGVNLLETLKEFDSQRDQLMNGNEWFHWMHTHIFEVIE